MASVASIAGQSVKNGRKTVKGGATGTQPKASYGKTQGMKPAAFAAYKGIVNQTVKKSDPYADVQNQVRERRKDTRAAYTPKQKEDVEAKFMETAKKRFQFAAEAESHIRKESLADLKFLVGEQWEDGIKRQREMDGRPCLTINRLPQFVRQVTNEQRQNRPSIQINPVGDGADEETAEILQGLVRHIENASAADAAYDTAFFGAASCGFGYWVVRTEYSGPLSFEQDIRISRIRNPFTVYLDPNAKEPDFSDADWGFIIEAFSEEAYKAEFPGTKLSKMADWQSIGDNGGWVSNDTCRVAEYFYRERKTETIVQLSDGSVMLKELLPEELPEGVRVTGERQTEIATVQWAKINGVEVLEETEWPGTWLPIVKVVGDEFDIDGKIVLKGVVRDAKEPQKQFNYMKSAVTEAIALAPKAPYVGAEGQFENHEHEWATANVKNYAFLQYKPVSLAGGIAPPPQRTVVEPAIQAINMAMMESDNDLKAVTGIYDPSLGAPSNEISGKAILARQQQTQAGNFHYIDNLTRSLRHTGRIIIELIQKVYDTARVVRILSEDGTQKMVQIAPGSQIASPQEMQAIERIYDVGVGKYDVTVSVGPSYQSKRQEAVNSILELTKAVPQLMGIAGDVLVRNMDWPGAEEIADRIRKTLPPQIQEEEEGPQELPPQVQAQMHQLMQQNQQLQQALQSAEQDIKQHVSVKKMEVDSRERIEAAKIRLDEAKLKIEAAKVQAAILTSQAQIDAKSADATAKAANDLMAQLAGEHHEAALAEMEHQHSMEAQQQMAALQPDDAQTDND